MKIEYIVGDLFDTDIEVIAHGCNAQGVMGSGVARTVRERFPKAFREYVEIANSAGLKMGAVYTTVDQDNGKVIANMITQFRFGGDGLRYVSYDAIAEACESLDKFCYIVGFKKVAMPQIGAGLGGGDWNIIEAIIENSMEFAQPVVYLLEPLKR